MTRYASCGTRGYAAAAEVCEDACCAAASTCFPRGASTKRRLKRPWLGHGRQGLPCAAVSGRQALGLSQPAGRGCHDTIAAGIATLAEVAKQAHRGVAPRIPALAEIRLIRVEDTVAEVAATFAPCKG